MMGSAFTCYWDDCGVDPGTAAKSKSDREFLVVAGYLSRIEEWESLEDRWRPVLAEYGLLEKGFHMVDFANFRRPYSTLGEVRYEALISSLLDIIRDLPRMYLSWALRVEDYMSVIKARNLLDTEIVRAYHILGRKCMESISDAARIGGYKEKIVHVFDQGNSAWPTFEPLFTAEILDGMNIYRPTAQQKKDVPQLQAADILAHQIGRLYMLEAHPEIVSQRMYTDRLLGKPGSRMFLEAGELFNAYQEELYLEDARTWRRPIERTFVRPVPSRYQAQANELFAEIFKGGGYPFDGRLRELQ